jgi:Fe-S-cluster containining protein
MSRGAERRLDRLYREIPTFDCIPGCTDCCGPVPATRTEAAKAPLLADAIQRAQKSGCFDCAYEKATGGCAVYDNRPFMCRLFGATSDPRLECPHGKGPRHPISAAKARALTDAYLRLMEEENRDPGT